MHQLWLVIFAIIPLFFLGLTRTSGISKKDLKILALQNSKSVEGKQ